MKTIHMGLNSISEEKVAEFVSEVETNGEASAAWSCTGRTLHLILSNQLRDKLRDKGYEWEIDYSSYTCIARK